LTCVAADAATLRRRQVIKPTPANPRIIMAQVEASGNAGASAGCIQAGPDEKRHTSQRPHSKVDHHESYSNQPARIDEKPVSDDRSAKIFPLKENWGHVAKPIGRRKKSHKQKGRSKGATYVSTRGFFSSAAAKFPMKESSLRISGTKPVPSASAARLSITCGRLSIASSCADISVSARCSRLTSRSWEAIDATPKLSTLYKGGSYQIPSFAQKQKGGSSNSYR